MAPRKGKSQQPEQVISLGPQVDDFVLVAWLSVVISSS